MKRPLLIILTFCLLLCLSACGKSQKSAEESVDAVLEETADVRTAEPTEPEEDVAEAESTPELPEKTVLMTESYEQGRQNYYETTGIMLPEVADVTMADSSCFEEEYACFDISGTYDLYTQIVAFFTNYFGSAPETGVSGNLEKSYWNFENDSGGTDCYEIYWNPTGLIYINYWKNV
ncbi:MAG TPA: hypothetical protein P5185_09310 [Oscillospiraceae bacterium]|nr:hypothetical protein [Oscillospiraceae bacterium]